MPSVLATLGLVTMLAACGTSYGETQSVPLPDRADESTSATEPAAHAEAKDAKKATETNPSAPARSAANAPQAQVVAGAPSSISFAWNQLTTTAEYSFDVLLKNHETVGPCISVDWIHQELTTTFGGSCPSSEAHPTIAMSDIEGFQICAAENDDWQHPTCAKVLWDGVASSLALVLVEN